MLCDPNDIPGQAFWYQDVQVCQGKEYVLSAWFYNVNPGGAMPRMGFKLNDQQIGNFLEVTNAQWTQFTTKFIANESGKFRLELLMADAGCDGRDIAIDDISLKACVGAVNIVADLGNYCQDRNINLSISDNQISLTEPAFQWQKSEDGGASWDDIEGANDTQLSHKLLTNPTLYRLVFAAQGESTSRDCRFYSNELAIPIPSCPEICDNGIDDDRDGDIDENCPQLNVILPSCDDPGITYYMPSFWHDTDVSSPQKLYISTAYDEAKVNIRTVDGTFNQDFVIGAGTPLDFILTPDIVLTQNINQAEKNKGLIITSDVPINPVYRIERNNNQIILTIKGNTALGNTFRVASNVRSDGNAGGEERHFFSFMATEDNTQVTIDQSPFPLAGLVLPHTVTLNAGETFLAHPENAQHHVTGTLIDSDKPIIVVSGSQHTGHKLLPGARDGGADQLIPVSRLGKEYVMAAGGINSPLVDIVMVVGAFDGTEIFVDGANGPVAQINAGQVHIVEINGGKGTPHFIRTSKNAYAYHVSGLTNGRAEFGMAILPPIDPFPCIGSRYLEYIGFPNSKNEAYVILPSNSLNSFRVNGELIANPVVQNVPGKPEFSLVYLDANILNPGINIIECDAYFHLAQLVASNDGGGGTYGFYSGYDVQVNALDPWRNLPTQYYIADTVCLGETISHTVLPQGCTEIHQIIAVEKAVGEANFEQGSLTFNYTAKETGLDVVRVLIENELGYQGVVCIGILISEAKADAGADKTICKGDSVLLSGTGLGTFSWTSQNLITAAADEAQLNVSPAFSGDYFFTVTNEFQCTDTDTVSVTVIDPPANNSIETIVCNQSILTDDLTRFEASINNIGLNGSFTYFDSLNSPIANPNSAPVLVGAPYAVVFEAQGATCKDTTHIVYKLEELKLTDFVRDSLCPENALNVDLTSFESAFTEERGDFRYLDLTGNEIDTPMNINVSSQNNFSIIFDDGTCRDTATLQFSFHERPPLNAGLDTALCLGDNIVLQASGALEYTWSATNNLDRLDIPQPIFRARTAGRFELDLLGTSIKGCNARDSLSITVNSLPDVELRTSESQICRGDSIVLEATGAEQYKWDPSELFDSITGSRYLIAPESTTMFQLEGVSADGCLNRDSVSIEVFDLPQISLSPDTAICIGQNTELKASEAASYMWSTGTNSSIIEVAPDSTTTFWVIPFSDFACQGDTARVEITVNPLPNAFAGEDTVICEGEELKFEASGGISYQWYPALNLSNPELASPVFTGPVSATYTVEVTDANKCKAVDTLNIQVNPLPVLAASITPSVICEGDSALFEAFGAEVYRWTSLDRTKVIDGNSIYITSSQNEWYELLGMSREGCSSKDSVLLEVRAKPEADLGTVDPVCEGDSTILTAYGAVNYLWSNGENSDLIWVAPPQTQDYWVIPFSDFGCRGDTLYTQAEVLSWPVAEFSFRADSAIAPLTIEFANFSQFANEYLWDFGDGEQSEETEPVHTFQKRGDWNTTLIAINKLGCSDTVSYEIPVKGPRIFAPNAFSPNQDGVNDTYSFGSIGIENLKVKIFNQWGRLVFDGSGVGTSWDGKVNGVAVPEGIYIFSLEAVGFDGTYFSKSGTITLMR